MENKENQPTNPVDAIVKDLNHFILGGLESTEVQFDEQEILLEEIDFFKDTVETFDSFDEFLEKKGIPQTFFQKHGYPSTKTQMTDLDKEMLNKA